MRQNIISNFESISEKDLAKYAGEWIAVIDNSIIYNSKSFKELYIYIKSKYSNKRPLIGKVPDLKLSIF